MCCFIFVAWSSGWTSFNLNKNLVELIQWSVLAVVGCVTCSKALHVEESICNRWTRGRFHRMLHHLQQDGRPLGPLSYQQFTLRCEGMGVILGRSGTTGTYAVTHTHDMMTPTGPARGNHGDENPWNPALDSTLTI